MTPSHHHKFFSIMNWIHLSLVIYGWIVTFTGALDHRQHPLVHDQEDPPRGSLHRFLLLGGKSRDPNETASFLASLSTSSSSAFPKWDIVQSRQPPCCQLWITLPRVLPPVPLQSDGLPVVLFLGGMLGLVPTYWYSDLYSRIALPASSVGSSAIVVGVDMLTTGPVNYMGAAERLRSILKWIHAGHLERQLQKKWPTRDGRAWVDSKRLVLASHSSGAQAVMKTLIRIESDPETMALIRALVLLDPVDAMGAPVYQHTGQSDRTEEDVESSMSYPPFTSDSAVSWLSRHLKPSSSVQKPYPPAVIAPHNKTQFLHYGFPVLMMTAGLCPVPAVNLSIPGWVDPRWLPPIFDVEHNSMWPACCPPYLGPDRFWKSLTGSVYFPQPYGPGPFRDRGDPKPNTSLPILSTPPVQTSEIRKDGGGISAWLIHARDFGHCDILDDFWVMTNRYLKFCKSIMDARAAARRGRGRGGLDGDSRDGPPYSTIFDMKAYRKLIANNVASFLDYSLYENERGRQYIEDGANKNQVVELYQVYSRRVADTLQ